MRHIKIAIVDLLEMSDERLEDIFEMKGCFIRKDLLERQKRGDVYIPTEGCEEFDPIKGCPGHPTTSDAPPELSAEKELPDISLPIRGSGKLLE